MQFKSMECKDNYCNTAKYLVNFENSKYIPQMTRPDVDEIYANIHQNGK